MAPLLMPVGRYKQALVVKANGEIAIRCRNQPALVQ
jgi:hypothetical protein